MARIRTIKPDFWEDEGIGLLSLQARLLFIATWNLADDEGILRWSPDYLKAQVFPYNPELTNTKVQKAMDELTGSFVFPYVAGPSRQRLAYIINFRKHQRINRPQPAKFPPPSIQSAEVREMYGRRDRMVCGICKGHIEDVTDSPCGEYDVPAGNRYWQQYNQRLSLDHIVPKSKGGADYPSNIQAAHVSCNKSRRDKHLTDSPTDSVNDSVNHSRTDSPPEGNGREIEGNGTGRGMDSVQDLQQQEQAQEPAADAAAAADHEKTKTAALEVLYTRRPGPRTNPTMHHKTVIDGLRNQYADKLAAVNWNTNWTPEQLANWIEPVVQARKPDEPRRDYQLTPLGCDQCEGGWIDTGAGYARCPNCDPANVA